jgi:intracellular multiplication protein IcmJ
MSVNVVRPLFISSKRTSWRMLDWHAGESDNRYAEIREKVLKRDNYQCAYCNFKSLKYQQLHHLDNDHGNNKPENLVTACALCHQCFHLGLAGVNHSGTIVYIPEISQSDLNSITRAIFIAVHNGGAHESSARTLYDALDSRSAVIEDNFGAGTSNPSSFGQAFVEMAPEDYKTRQQRMPGLRLLAKMQAFGKEIAYWKGDDATFARILDSDWVKLIPIRENDAILDDHSDVITESSFSDHDDDEEFIDENPE